MGKNLFTISLKWGMLIGAFQIISHSLLIYVFSDASLSIRNTIEIITILISIFFIYYSVRSYKQTLDNSKSFTILKAFYAGICPLLFFIILFILYFIILIYWIDPSFISHYSVNVNTVKDVNGTALQNDLQAYIPLLYIIKYINHYLIFQITTALILAAFMQRKPEDSTTEVDNNKNN
jgi:hypothetical protein